MRYLITGGAGFIGSHLGEALIDRGDEVISVDDLSTGNSANVEALRSAPKFTEIVGSVLDPSLMSELVEQVDIVVHLAAAVGVKLITEHPLRSLETNVGGTSNVLSACDRFRKAVLVASSSEVYGRAQGPLAEESFRVVGATTSPRWSYAAAKTLDETLALAYWDEHRLPAVVVRFFNTVGPRQTGSYGMVLPRLIAQSLTGRDLTVFGDGSQSRCFCHVDDTVRAVVGLLDDSRAVGNVFNIGSTEEVSILDAAKRVVTRTESNSKIRLVPYEDIYGGRFEDLPKRVPDCTKIQQLIGWAPQQTFDMILDDVIRSARERGPESLLGGESDADSSPTESDKPPRIRRTKGSSVPAQSSSAPADINSSTPAEDGHLGRIVPLHGARDPEPTNDPFAATIAEYFGALPGQDAENLRDEVQCLSTREASELIASITGPVLTLRILVIAASAAVGNVLKVTFEHEGHQVTLARDCASAIDALSGELPDAVILDINLPDGDGIALLHRLRGAVSPSTPIMVLSGLRQESTIVKVLKSGADDYITKPFNPRELVARLQRRLGA